MMTERCMNKHYSKAWCIIFNAHNLTWFFYINPVSVHLEILLSYSYIKKQKCVSQPEEGITLINIQKGLFLPKKKYYQSINQTTEGI